MINKIKTFCLQPKGQRLPYIIIFVLFCLQFGYIYLNPEPLVANFWIVVGIALGVLAIQIWWNHQVLWFLILGAFSVLIAYLMLAFLSDLVKAEDFDFSFFRFLLLGFLFFGLLFFTELLLIFSKPNP